MPRTTITPPAELLSAVHAHADTLVEYGTDRYGPLHTPMFMATLDPATKAYPVDDTRPDTFVQRAYRHIHAPRGCAVYWDQPTLASLAILSRITGDGRYQRAVDAYLSFFMEHCVAAGGMFLWGNHYYWDAFQDQNVEFDGDRPPVPVDLNRPAILHEMRPVFPAWDALYRLNPGATEQEIRTAAEWHLFDPASGGFNRHADKKRSCAFLEAGAILVHSLGFLFAKTGDPALLDAALRIARYSFEQRNPETGLLINNPTQTRWDGHMTTTEVGLWARALFRAAGHIRSRGADPIGESAAGELITLGREALAAYLRYGYDPEQRSYYGRLNPDGTPNLNPRSTPYMPGEHSDVWEFLFPTHDYPMSMGMATLECLDGDPLFAEGAKRLADMAVASVATRPQGHVRYAENYGRIAVYLTEYARVTGEQRYRTAAEDLAQEAVRELAREDMLVGRTGANWYDAIDGVGYLLLSLLFLETGDRETLALF
jgi:hypothetical protein